MSEEISQWEAFDEAGSRFAKYYASFAEENQLRNEKLEEDLENLFSALEILRNHKAWAAVGKLIDALNIFLDGGRLFGPVALLVRAGLRQFEQDSRRGDPDGELPQLSTTSWLSGDETEIS